MKDIKSVSRFIVCLHYLFLAVPAPFLKRLSLLHCIVFSPLSKISCMDLFQRSLSNFIDLCTYFSTKSHCFDCCNFTVSFEVKKCLSYTLFFPLSILLAILAFLPLCINFKISLLIFIIIFLNK